jgi:hypothetical protein
MMERQIESPMPLQFAIYWDGDNNLDQIQSPVIDQAFESSRRDPSIAFDVEDFTARRDFTGTPAAASTASSRTNPSWRPSASRARSRMPGFLFIKPERPYQTDRAVEVVGQVDFARFAR